MLNHAHTSPHSLGHQVPPDWCRWAKKDSGSSNASTSEALQLPATGAPASWDQQGNPAAPEEQWSLQTRQALAVVDEAVLNFDLIEALVCHIVEVEAACGPGAMLQVNTVLCQAVMCHLVEAKEPTALWPRQRPRNMSGVALMCPVVEVKAGCCPGACWRQAVTESLPT